jgi:hypothetical protein
MEGLWETLQVLSSVDASFGLGRHNSQGPHHGPNSLLTFKLEKKPITGWEETLRVINPCESEMDTRMGVEMEWNLVVKKGLQFASANPNTKVVEMVSPAPPHVPLAKFK